MTIKEQYLEKAVQMYKDGEKIKHIAGNCGGPSILPYLYREIAKRKLPRRNSNSRSKSSTSIGDLQRIARERAEDLLVLYNDGYTLAEIGKMQNPPVSRQRVCQILKTTGKYIRRKRTKAPLTPTEQAVLEDYYNGVSMRDIEAKWGYKSGKISVLRLRRADEPLPARGPRGRPRNPQIRQRDDEIIWHYYNSLHLTIGDIAEMYGVGPFYPSTLIYKRNLPKAPARMERKGLTKGIKECLNRGINDNQEIADIVGCSQTYVRTIKSKLRCNGYSFAAE